MGDLSEHFSTSEMACHHCGKLELDSKLVPALEQLRTLAGQPILVHDAYRCAIHNAQVGGAPHSEHMLGIAADISFQPPKSAKEMYDLAIQVPDFANGGIGLYSEDLIHVDVRGKAARWSRVQGKYCAIEEILNGD